MAVTSTAAATAAAAVTATATATTTAATTGAARCQRLDGQWTASGKKIRQIINRLVKQLCRIAHKAKIF